MEQLENLLRTIAIALTEDFYGVLMDGFVLLGLASFAFLFLDKIGFFNLSIKRLLIGGSTLAIGGCVLGALAGNIGAGLGTAGMIFVMNIFLGMFSKEREAD